MAERYYPGDPLPPGVPPPRNRGDDLIGELLALRVQPILHPADTAPARTPPADELPGDVYDPAIVPKPPSGDGEQIRRAPVEFDPYRFDPPL